MIGVQLYQNLDGTEQALDATLVKLKNAIMNTPVDGTYTLANILKILGSIAVGKTNINTGGASPVITFRNISDTNNAVVATMSGSQRSSVVIDVAS